MSWLLPGYSEPLDRWAKDGKYTFSFNVMAGNLACMQPDLPEWARYKAVLEGIQFCLSAPGLASP